MKTSMRLTWLFLLLGLNACERFTESDADSSDGKKPKPMPLAESFVPTPFSEPDLTSTNRGLIEDAVIHPVKGSKIPNGYILWENGIIKEIGSGSFSGDKSNLSTYIRGEKKLHVTPGLIDTHSHMGVYPQPEADAHGDGNEATSPNTSDVWAEHSFWPQDPQIWRALAGGVTTVQILPGSANLFGGRSFTAKLRPAAINTTSNPAGASGSARAMRFPHAPQGLKMACGENPKRVYGEKSGPSTRMGNVAGYRKAWQDALEYQTKWTTYDRDLAFFRERRQAILNDEKGAMLDSNKQTQEEGLSPRQLKRLKELGDPPKIPDRNFKLETLAGVLKGEILVHNHCYRADEMNIMLDIAHEYGFKIRSFHHALEAYKIRHRLAAEAVSVSTWADWWGFKMEAYDGISYNLAMLQDAGVKTIVHSDSGEDIRFLNVEAAKGARSGKELGLDFSEDQVLSWITLNPAWALGVDQWVGSLEPGKMADLVVWDEHPLQGSAKTKQVIIDGALVFDRTQNLYPLSDFELGYMPETTLFDGRDITINQDLNLPVDGFGAAPNRDFTYPNAPSQVLIRNVIINPGDGNAAYGPTDILMASGIIKTIGKNLQASPGIPTQHIEGNARQLTPGLIETNTTLGLIEVELESSTRDHSIGQKDPIAPGFLTYYGFHASSIRIPVNRAEGITTAVSNPDDSFLGGVGFSFQLTGGLDAITYPQLVMTAKISGGKTSRGRNMEHLERLTTETHWFAKHRSEVTTEDQRLLTFGRQDLESFLKVLQGSVSLAVKVDRASDILHLLNWRTQTKALSPDYKPHIIIVGGRESWKVANQLKAAQVPVVVSPSKQTPGNFDAISVRDDLASFLVSQGIAIALTTGDIDARRLRQQAIHAVRFGLPKSFALAAITGWPAKIYGLSKVGIIAEGNRADVILWDQDPLLVEARPSHIWINGMEQDQQHRQLLLAKRYLK